MKRRLVIHPILFGLYPVLALFAHNISSLSIQNILRPAFVLLTCSILLLLVFRWILKDWDKAGLASSWLIFLVFTYGQIYPLVKNFTLLGVRLGRDTIFAFLWLVLLVGGWVLIVRKLKNGAVLTQVLNVVGTVLLVLPLLQIGYHEVSQAKTSTPAGGSSAADQAAKAPVDLNLGSPAPARPDVYYIILDTYPRADVISGTLGIDNSGFINTLKGLGFYVAGCSQSNYGNTELSLASSLNMDYLDQVNPQTVKTSADSSVVVPQLLHNRVEQDFRAMGYKIVAFESGFSPTEWVDADVYLHQDEPFIQQTFGFPGLNPFEGILFKTTPGILYLDLRVKLDLPRLPWFDYAYTEYRNRILYELDHLESAALIPGPKFVFVHILAPHTPIVFGPEGEPVPRDYPFNLNQDIEYIDFQKYRQEFGGELVYLNHRVEEFVRSILQESAVPPIIIIQGDHGLPKAGDSYGQMGNLNAYDLPGSGAQQLYPNITPVNSFRIVFNEYFGGQFSLLPDNSYQSNPNTPFKLTQVPGASGCSGAINK